MTIELLLKVRVLILNFSRLKVTALKIRTGQVGGSTLKLGRPMQNLPSASIRAGAIYSTVCTGVKFWQKLKNHTVEWHHHPGSSQCYIVHKFEDHRTLWDTNILLFQVITQACLCLFGLTEYPARWNGEVIAQ